MYCVLCGIFLRENNQAGIVCQGCKQEHRAREKRYRRRNGGLPICVRYCFRCGKPYTPDGPSIRHLHHLYGFADLGDSVGEQEEQHSQYPHLPACAPVLS